MSTSIRALICPGITLLSLLILNCNTYAGNENDPTLAGGTNTYTGPINTNAYSHASTALSPLQAMDFNLGNALFRRVWATGIGSARSSDGLGPLFNSRSCQRCHRKDGRGHPPLVPDEPAVSFIMQLESDRKQKTPQGDQTYGKQLQPFAVPGMLAEGNVSIRYEEVVYTYPDASKTSLMKPIYRIRDLQQGELAKSTILSPRVAPQMIGLGLLAAIPKHSIMKNVDPDDANQDGISGQANYGYSLLHGETMLGRFGWKASAPTIKDQVAAAFATDMGLSTPLIHTDYGDCTDKQTKCQEEALRTDDSNEIVEIKPAMFDLISFYSANLAVPKTRHSSPQKRAQGRKLFNAIGCQKCHTEHFTTSDSNEIPEHFRKQQIWPYTDLLLHDMGEALSDLSRSGFAADNEWRTAPLWGIGLSQTVNKKTKFLHDGRARSIEEAILWHGGEAESSRDHFAQLSKQDRQVLLQFVNNL